MARGTRDRAPRLPALVRELHEALVGSQTPPVGVNYPAEIDGFLESGMAVVGTTA